MTNKNYNRIKKFTHRAINERRAIIEHRKVEDYQTYELEYLAFDIADSYKNRHHYFYKLSYDELYDTILEILEEIARK